MRVKATAVTKIEWPSHKYQDKVIRKRTTPVYDFVDGEYVENWEQVGSWCVNCEKWAWAVGVHCRGTEPANSVKEALEE